MHQKRVAYIEIDSLKIYHNLGTDFIQSIIAKYQYHLLPHSKTSARSCKVQVSNSRVKVKLLDLRDSETPGFT